MSCCGFGVVDDRRQVCRRFFLLGGWGLGGCGGCGLVLWWVMGVDLGVFRVGCDVI